MEITPEQRDDRYNSSNEDIKRLYDSEESGQFLYSVFKKNSLTEEKYKTYAITVGNVILGFYPVSELSKQLQKELDIPENKAKKITADLIDFLSPVINANSPGDVAAVSTRQTETPVSPDDDPVGAASPLNEPDTPTVTGLDQSALLGQSQATMQISFTPTAVTVTPKLTPSPDPTPPISSPQQPEAVVQPPAPPTTTPEPTTEPDTGVQPLRTMPEDVDKIHGYGAYRKLYPDQAPSSKPEATDPATDETDTESNPPTVSQAPVTKLPNSPNKPPVPPPNYGPPAQ